MGDQDTKKDELKEEEVKNEELTDEELDDVAGGRTRPGFVPNETPSGS